MISVSNPALEFDRPNIVITMPVEPVLSRLMMKLLFVHEYVCESVSTWLQTHSEPNPDSNAYARSELWLCGLTHKSFQHRTSPCFKMIIQRSDLGGRPNCRTHPIPVTVMDARCPSASQVSGQTTWGKNTPELLRISSSANGRTVATLLPVLGPVRFPLNGERQHLVV